MWYRYAPAYDLVSTEAYAHTDRLGMRIGSADRLRDVTRESLLAQADGLGVPPRLAARILAELAERLPSGFAAARDRAEGEGWASPIVDRIVEASIARARRILT